MVWWFNTKVALHNGSAGSHGNGMKANNLGTQSQASQHACSSLCDEVVILWRLAALNPGLSNEERQLLHQQFSEWHVKVIDKVTKSKGISATSNVGQQQQQAGGGGAGAPVTPRRASQSLKVEIEVFTGFKPSIEACYLSWDDYPVPGVTYTQGHRLYHCPFTCFRHSDAHGRVDIGQINASSAVLKNDLPVHMIQRRVQENAGVHMWEELRCNAEGGRNSGFMPPPSPSVAAAARAEDRAGNRSSVSSEGFCENDGDLGPAAEGNFGGGGGGAGGGAAAAGPLARELARQDSDDQALCSDTNEPEVLMLAADSCNSTDKDKSSPEDCDADSDWSGVAEAVRARAGGLDAVAHSCTTSIQPLGSSCSIGEQGGAEADQDQAIAAAVQLDQASSMFVAPAPMMANPPYVSSVASKSSGVFGELKPLDDPLEILFARAEGLHAHGHSAEACELGVQLASELLANPPDLMIDLPPILTKSGKKKKTNPACHQISCLASATLAKCAFLCTVLAENVEYYHLAFRVGMFGLELPRHPATTKPLEVKLSHQESELVTLLKR